MIFFAWGDDMELESVSKISKDDYCRFFRFVNFKTGWRKVLIPVFLALLIVMAAEIALMAFYSIDSSMILFVVLMAFLLAFVLLDIWFIAPRLFYKAAARLYSIDNYFTWYEDHFTVKADGDGISSISDFRYSGLLKVWEGRDFLYIYVTKNIAYIVPKDSFTKGTWIELSGALRGALGERYRAYR